MSSEPVSNSSSSQFPKGANQMNRNPYYHITIEKYSRPLLTPSKEENSLSFNYLNPTQFRYISNLLENIGDTPFTDIQDLPDQPTLFLFHTDGTDEETNIHMVVCRPSDLETALCPEEEEVYYFNDYIILPLIIDPPLWSITFFQELIEENNRKDINFHFNNGFIC